MLCSYRLVVECYLDIWPLGLSDDWGGDKMKALKWLAVNGLMAGMIYLWLVQGVDGAGYVVRFVTWLSFVVVLIVFSTYLSGARDESLTPSVPALVDVTYDVGVLLAFVWTGHIGLAVVYTITSVLQHSIFNMTAEHIDGKQRSS